MVGGLFEIKIEFSLISSAKLGENNESWHEKSEARFYFDLEEDFGARSNRSRIKSSFHP